MAAGVGLGVGTQVDTSSMRSSADKYETALQQSQQAANQAIAQAVVRLMQDIEQMMHETADMMSSLGFPPPSGPHIPIPSKNTIKGAKDFAQKHPDEANEIKEQYAQVQDDKKALNKAIMTYGPHSPQAMNAGMQLQTDKMVLMTDVMIALNIHTMDQLRDYSLPSVPYKR